MSKDLPKKVIEINVESGDPFEKALAFLLELERGIGVKLGKHTIVVEGPSGLTVSRSTLRDSISEVVAYRRKNEIMDDANRNFPLTKYENQLPYLAVLQLLADRHIPALLTQPAKISYFGKSPP